jgi:hypothetical protein
MWSLVLHEVYTKLITFHALNLVKTSSRSHIQRRYYHGGQLHFPLWDRKHTIWGCKLFNTASTTMRD